MTVGGLLEWVLGNTFPFVVFASFGAFWLTFAATLQPFYMAYGSYAPPGGAVAEGLTTVGFTASFAFFLLFMGVLCFIYLICSLRTNIVFVIIFFTLVMVFTLLAAAYWQNANSIANNDPSAAALAGKLQKAGGAFAFVTCMAGWWIFAAIMLASLDFPFSLPVGDLSTMIKSGTEKQKEKDSMAWVVWCVYGGKACLVGETGRCWEIWKFWWLAFWRACKYCMYCIVGVLSLSIKWVTIYQEK